MRRRKCPLQSAIVVVIDQRTKISMKNMSSCEKSRTPSPSAAVGGCRLQNESRAAGLTARRCDVGLTSTWFEAALLDVNRLYSDVDRSISSMRRFPISVLGASPRSDGACRAGGSTAKLFETTTCRTRCPETHLGWSNVTESMVAIQSPYCGYITRHNIFSWGTKIYSDFQIKLNQLV